MGKKKLLYIMLTVFALSVLYRIFTVQEDKRAPLKYKTGIMSSELRVRNSKFNAGKEEIPKIELSKLTLIKIKPPANGVNLFYPFFMKEPIKEPLPIPTPPKPVVALPPPVPLPPPVDPLEEELKLFRFMGFLEKGVDKKIFLAKGQNIYVVKSVDTIEDKFRVNAAKGSIEISAINSDKKVTIQIEER